MKRSINQIPKKLFITVSIIFFFIININNSHGQVAIDTAVDFSVKDVYSKSHHLYNYLDNDKIVVIDFFTTTCGPCQTYATQISDAYDYFGCNEGNVIFLGMNWGSTNDQVINFDSLWDARYPSVSGTQGGGDAVVEAWQVLSYPTVTVITPDHLIFNQHIWPPASDSIIQVVTMAGGIPQPCTVSSQHLNIKSSSRLNMLTGGALQMNLTGLQGRILTLNIFSLDGKMRYVEQIPRCENYIVRPQLAKGFYLVRLILDNHVIESCKFIVN